MEDDMINKFIESSKASNTKYGDNMSYNQMKRFLVSVNESREVEDLPPEILSQNICEFFMNVKKQNGSEYEPDSLSTIYRGLNRYLQTKNYGYDIIHHELFNNCKRVLKAKRKLLRKGGKGNKPNATRELTTEEVDVLFNERYFSVDNAESLTNAIWWVLSLHFGFRARDESRKLKWGDVVIGKDEKGEYLEWTIERGTKTRDGGDEHETSRKFDPRVYATNLDRCPIMFYKEYANKRPTDAKNPDSPFFLALDHSNTDRWYKNQPMGKNKIGEILSKARRRFGFGGRKIANHTVRKTGIGRLLDADVPEIFVAQHAGMACTDSLKSYKSAGKKQIREMSTVLSEKSSCTLDAPSNSYSSDNISPSSSQTNVLSSSQSSSMTSSMFSGNAFQNCQRCTFNFNIPWSKKQKKTGMKLLEFSSSDSDFE